MLKKRLLTCLLFFICVSFTSAEVCDIPPVDPSVIERIDNRSFPSLVQTWNPVILPNVTKEEGMAKHDLYWETYFGLMSLSTKPAVHLTDQLGGDLERAKNMRRSLLDLNPNMVFMIALNFTAHSDEGAFPPDSQLWLRGENGNRIKSEYGEYLWNITHPELQKCAIDFILAISNCGLFDGVFIDNFQLWYVGRDQNPATDEELINAFDNILRNAREGVRDDFLIITNGNEHKPIHYAKYINGTFMEVFPEHQNAYSFEQLRYFEDTLLWSERNTLSPQVNILRPQGFGQFAGDSPENKRWMRLFTTVSLTHSDGYVLYTRGRDDPGGHHAHIWYDFWDADLGRPVGGNETKGQIYENREGLFIREFTNGWVVYNRSGKQQTISLPVETTGVASNVVDTQHVLADLDGEIYLRLHVADVNSDGIVNVLDLVVVANAFGAAGPDLNGDEIVNIQDLVIVANAF